MNTSRLQPALLFSLVMHIVLLGFLRLIPLPSLQVSTPMAPDMPVAVQLLEVPPAAPPAARRPSERAQALPDAPSRKLAPEVQKTLPPPRAPEPSTPKSNTLSTPRKGGTVVDLPKPVREERPDDARIISRYDSKAQDLGPGAGGTRTPLSEQPRTVPPEIPLPERSSKGQPTPPSAPLMPTTPVTPPPSGVLPSTPKTAALPPAAAETSPLAPPPPAPQSEMLTPPLPPVPIPQTKPEPPPRLVAPVTPRVPSEDRAPLLETAPGAVGQAKATIPPPPEPPRVAREEKRRPDVPPVASIPQAKTAPPHPLPPQALSEEKRRVEAPPRVPPAPDIPSRPLTPEEQRRFRMTAQQELAMMQRDPQARAATGKTTGQGKQSLEEHFATLEKHQPLLSFDGPGVSGRGPERSGEGRGDGEGGKYRSIASFGFKHVSYLLGMQRKIELVFSVPSVASDRAVVGVPIVGFTVRRNGELAETVLLRSSGHPTIDQALIRAVKRAAPYHPFPDDMPDQEISIRIYATFS